MKRFFLLLIPIILLTSCKKDANTKIKSTSPHIALLENSANMLTQLSEANANTVISPLSINMSVALLSNGAANSTLKEFNTFLGGDISTVNNYYQELLKAYNEQTKINLKLSNKLFLNNIEPNKVFTDAIKSNYHTDIDNLDFTSANTVPIINDWIKKETHGLIERVIEQLSNNDRLLIIDSLYFKADWNTPFRKEKNTLALFNNRAGNKNKITYMHSDNNIGYYENKNIDAVVLDYRNKRFAMVFILPINDKESLTLTTELMKEIDTGYKLKTIDLFIPKLQLDYFIELNTFFADNGLKSAFQSNADFTKINNSESLYISNIIHKVKLIVDENGTEAASTSTVALETSSIKKHFKTIKYDRPFIFYLWDKEAKIPVFAGNVEKL